LEVISAPPSEEIMPPLLAVFREIIVMSAVLTAGTTILFSEQLPVRVHNNITIRILSLPQIPKEFAFPLMSDRNVYLMIHKIKH
jgi:hypothetical protein